MKTVGAHGADEQGEVDLGRRGDLDDRSCEGRTVGPRGERRWPWRRPAGGSAAPALALTPLARRPRRRLVAGGQAAASQPSCLARATKVGGASSSGRVVSGRPSASSGVLHLGSRERSAPGAARPGAAPDSEFTICLRRWPKDGAHEGARARRRRRPPPRQRVKVTKAESTRGCGAKTVRGTAALRLELAGELHQHRHGRVGLGARHREQPLGELALQHHGPAPQAREHGDGAHQQGHRDVVGEVGHQGGRRRSRSASG